MVSPYLEADCVRRGRWTALRLSTTKITYTLQPARPSYTRQSYTK